MTTTLDDLLRASSADLFAVVRAAHPLDLDAIGDATYTGIDLSMPGWFHKLMWKSFRKTFYRDPVTGVHRGWNVKVEQVGWDTPPPPKRDRSGRSLSFGHYEVRSARGLTFPRGWQGEHYLDYRQAGNAWYDFPANAGYCPLVAVNPGDMTLLLGWEIFKVGGITIPLPDYWVLVREGPLRAEDIVPRPDQAKGLGLPEQAQGPTP